MIGRKTVIGLTVLCALLVSAFAAQGASAAGTTAYTCKATPGSGTFKAAHCKEEDAGGTGFTHVAITEETEIRGSSKDTSGNETGAILKSTVAGSAVELIATGVGGSGTMKNSEEGGEMIASGEGKIIYTGVTEKLLGCKVTGKPGGAGTVETKQLSATTKGAGMGLKFTPKEGTVFAEFELTECTVGPTTVKVVGSVTGAVNGATTTTTHNGVTTEGGLHLGSAFGPVAGIAGLLTIEGRKVKSSEAWTPISATT